jgi:Leucine-rich repeat (LRR) protein
MIIALVAWCAVAQDEAAAGRVEERSEINQEVSQSGEALIVRSILDKNGLTTIAVGDVALFSGGRLVALNLSNTEVGSAGISVLPPEVGTLTSCAELLLNDNDLVELPGEIGGLTALRKLEVRNNSLVSVPATIGRLDNLEELDLRNNELTSLPIEIALCSRLWKLQLWGNSLRSLPETIGSLSSLRELYLRGNRLSTFPQSALKLKLRYIDTQENRLCDVQGNVDLWLKKFDSKYRSWQKCW